MFPRGRGNFVGVEGFFGFLTVSLSPLTGFASVNVLPNVRLDVRPPVVSCDKFLCFVSSGMSCDDTIVVFSNDVFSEAFVLWDVDSFLPGYNSFFMFLPEFLFIDESLFDDFVSCSF